MRPRIRHLRSLLAQGMYPLDEREVAGAILARSRLRALVPDVRLPGLRGARPRDGFNRR